MTDKYETDNWLKYIFHDELYFDPCPINWNKDIHASGLDMSWYERVAYDNYYGVFVNPPYSNPKPWVEKAISENKTNGIMIVMLLKHDSSTEWFRLLHEAGARLMMINGRLKHNTGKGAAFPSVLAVLT